MPRDDARSTAEHFRRLLSRPRVRAGEESEFEGLESLGSSAPEPPAVPVPDDVLQRVADSLARAPERAAVDPNDYEKALRIFLAQGEGALRKLADEPETLDAHDQFTIEAVIRTDGTRPALLLQNGQVDTGHPMAATWLDRITAAAVAIQTCAAAIGRVEPMFPTAANLFGTATLVASIPPDRGLVLTNLHVLNAARRALPAAFTPTDDGFTVSDGVFVEFLAELGATRTNRFKVVAARPSGIDGAGFARLDVSVLTIAPIDGQTSAMPTPLSFKADTAGPLGQMSSFCVIGHPGQPEFSGGVHQNVDWTWVIGTLFGNRFGVKRMSPGIAHRPLGSFIGDARPWVFGHDATTLGGSSGSPVIAWLDPGHAAFGLHFAGSSTTTNCAHAVASCRTELERLGVPVVS